MTLMRGLCEWWQFQTGDDDNPFDIDTASWVSSLVVHLIVLIAVAYLRMPDDKPDIEMSLVVTPEEQVEPDVTEIPQEFYFDDQPQEEVGANSVNGVEMALAQAMEVSEVSNIPTPTDFEPVEVGEIAMNNEVIVATGLHKSENLAVKGAAGVGTTGASGAIDRLTHEILRSLEERKTLVVWLFDQSPSMIRQRTEVLDRFEKVYRELGVIEASGNQVFTKHENEPLLTSVMCFGKGVQLMTPQPTANLAEVKAAVANIQPDESGQEKTFSAIYMAADTYRALRIPQAETGQPKRNVMVIAFTDEVGDDTQGLDETVKLCRKHEIPVYVVGVPAPFGRRDTMVKWVDPDPKFDQTAQWGVVYQGPESFLPEIVKLGFSGTQEKAPSIDSGFGPFALTRLCVETGGIYFSVHPNRNVNRHVSRGETEAFSSHIEYFFDPFIMRKYRPDYCSVNEYKQRLMQNQCRLALVQAADLSALDQMQSPQLRFVKRDEGQFGTELSEAQQEAARLEPRIASVYEILKRGEADREREVIPRWQAGYDLSMGRVLAAKVRTEGYNTMLAIGKTRKFEGKNNVLVLQASNQIGGGSQLEKVAKQAEMFLRRVVAEHPDTPWSMMAERELKDPLGWAWKEEFMDLTPRRENPGNNNNPPPPSDDKKMMLQRPPSRPIPKNL